MMRSSNSPCQRPPPPQPHSSPNDDVALVTPTISSTTMTAVAAPNSSNKVPAPASSMVKPALNWEKWEKLKSRQLEWKQRNEYVTGGTSDASTTSRPTPRNGSRRLQSDMRIIRDSLADSNACKEEAAVPSEGTAMNSTVPSTGSIPSSIDRDNSLAEEELAYAKTFLFSITDPKERKRYEKYGLDLCVLLGAMTHRQGVKVLDRIDNVDHSIGKLSTKVDDSVVKIENGIAIAAVDFSNNTKAEADRVIDTLTTTVTSCMSEQAALKQVRNELEEKEWQLKEKLEVEKLLKEKLESRVKVEKELKEELETREFELFEAKIALEQELEAKSKDAKDEDATSKLEAMVEKQDSEYPPTTATARVLEKTTPAVSSSAVGKAPRQCQSSMLPRPTKSSRLRNQTNTRSGSAQGKIALPAQPYLNNIKKVEKENAARAGNRLSRKPAARVQHPHRFR